MSRGSRTRILQKYWLHIKIVDARKVTRNKLNAEYVQILGTTVLNSVSTATWHPGVSHHWT